MSRNCNALVITEDLHDCFVDYDEVHILHELFFQHMPIIAMLVWADDVYGGIISFQQVLIVRLRWTGCINRKVTRR
jgi:hypothetical protein